MRIAHPNNEVRGVTPPDFVNTIKNGKYHMYIGTPSRDERCYIGYASSLAYTVAAFIAAGVEVSMNQVRNSCFVSVSRNLLLKQFLDSTATHILMIDDDMSWTPLAPLKMLATGKDFIGGAGPVKHDKRFAVTKLSQEGELYTVREIGAAFIMLSREMVEKMVERYKHLSHPFYEGFPRLFEDQHTPTQWITEDYVFCDRWREMGGKVYCYPDITFEHLGLTAQVGNYKEHLDGQFDINQKVKEVSNKCY